MKKNSKSDTPHFDYGISSCQDMFKKLHHEGDRLSEECHPYDCFNFFVTAWHLNNEWIDKDVNRPTLSLEKRGRASKEMKKLIKGFKDLANGSKHMLLNPGNYKRKVVKNAHSPVIGDWRSYFSNKPEVYISVGDSTYSMWDIRYIAIHYFTWIFDDSVPATQFPKEIQDHLQRCINRPSTSASMRNSDQPH